MHVQVTSDPAAFSRLVFPFLQKDPVLNTIILSNVRERAVGIRPADDVPPYFVSVHDPDVIGVAMRTQGRGVYLGSLRADLVDVVADQYLELYDGVASEGLYDEAVPGGVAGEAAAAQRFADRWCERRGGRAQEAMRTRLHKLITHTPLTAEAGTARLMRAEDADLITDWGQAGFPELRGSHDWAAQRLADETMWIWEVDGEPVSMVGYHMPIFGVCRVGPVYTPEMHRRRGYAGALTSRVTAEILAQSNLACLYTDLANPTSNKIYAQIGYEPVADFVVLEYTA
ncbi:GNAT family N-acetyltransferase [Kribbella sp. NBC_01505]|uniref:GNAT family N-acetyltransferase n=1 Tax=Kribbella sp. NBC_01505 TaxID=2903580 RepID=UPI00386A6EA3